jgi:hypothetical protein
MDPLAPGIDVSLIGMSAPFARLVNPDVLAVELPGILEALLRQAHNGGVHAANDGSEGETVLQTSG